MIDLTSPIVRAELPLAKSLAIHGKPGEAISMLETTLSERESTLDRVALLVAIAGILHWDYRDSEAISLFDERIMPLTNKIPEKSRIAVEYNRSDISHSLLQADDFYGMFDRALIADVNLWDYQSYFEVFAAREKGKRYESLPSIWRELLRCYHQGCWRPHRLASAIMSRECMDLGWPHESVFHAVIADDKQIATQLGDTLLVQGTPEVIENCTKKWMECTNLRRHFIIGCEMLDQFYDAIPDTWFGSVFDRLCSKACESSDDRLKQIAISRAWDTLAKLSWRLDSSQAEKLVRSAIQHPIWLAPVEGRNQVLTVRDKMMQSLTHCSDKISPACYTELIDASLPLALDRKQHTDYPDAINLLCSLADAGDEEAKQRLRASLFPSGQPLDEYRLQVIGKFGAEISNPEALSADARNVANRVRQQVQTCPLGQEVKTEAGSFGVFTIQKGDRKLAVQMAGTVYLNAILRHRKHLAKDSLEALLSAIVDMIREPENLISNKVQLVQAIKSIGDTCSDEQAKCIFEVLAPISSGEVTEPPSSMSSAEAENPLNPFRVATGNPSDLQGVSIYTLACIDRDKPGVFGGALDGIIEKGLTSHQAQVRALALAAAREKPTLSEAEFTAIIMSTRDHDPTVANAAFCALANKKSLKLNRPQWRLLIHSSGLASRSDAVVLRRAAAYCCAKLRGYLSIKSLHRDLDAVLIALSNDKCASVRRQLLGCDLS
ncbi:hypothetical protein Enr13x_51700 [Stieleria neptunia]|uniref:Uncharacterized protein n=1 Tax=Stieleria neptunia TaxID=2527979 RepID=A0A518HX06_9BACT|nr:hypothetical protein [Stieleria neptunia]QDV45294.1 hypothetical protein Enr13x_51700 [Stieleria neptunia]